MKKTFFALITFIFLLNFTLVSAKTVTLWNGKISEAFETGDGSPDSPYEIENGKQLAYLAEKVNSGENFSGKHFILTNDIVLNNISETDVSAFSSNTEEYSEAIKNVSSLKPWTPIGDISEFAGIFDGNGYTVYGLYNNGLFGISSGVIKNLNIKNVISVISTDGAFGGIVRENKGVVSHCSSNGIIIRYTYGMSYMGGIVGINYGNIEKSYNLARIRNIHAKPEPNSFFVAGGIVGYNKANGKIESCYNYGHVTSEIFKTHFTNDDINNFGNITEVDYSNLSCGIVGISTSSPKNISQDCYSINTGTYVFSEPSIFRGPVTKNNNETIRISSITFPHIIESLLNKGTPHQVIGKYYYQNGNDYDIFESYENISEISSLITELPLYYDFDVEACSFSDPKKIFSSGVWTWDKKAEYPYPQLIENPQSKFEILEIIEEVPEKQEEFVIPPSDTNEIRVFVNGKQLEFDQPPIIENNSTLVPMRYIFEALNSTVYWNDRTKTAIATKSGITIKIPINSSYMYKNDEKIQLNTPAKLKNGRTLVPVRAISESFNSKVDWNEEKRAVIINY